MQFKTDTNIDSYQCEVIFNFKANDCNNFFFKEDDKFIFNIYLKERYIKENQIKQIVNSISKTLNNNKINSVILPYISVGFKLHILLLKNLGKV